jgi:hypothetical protein
MPFMEQGGSVVRDLAMRHDGDYAGPLTDWKHHGIEFNGPSGDFVDLRRPSGPIIWRGGATPFSFSIWLHAHQEFSEQYIVFEGVNTATSWVRLRTRNSPEYEFLLREQGGNQLITSGDLLTTSSPVDGVTYHMITVTCDGNEAKIYVDGVVEDSHVYGPSIVTGTENSTYTRVMGGFNLPNNTGRGDVADFKAWHRGLSSGEVADMYTDEKGGIWSIYKGSKVVSTHRL